MSKITFPTVVYLWLDLLRSGQFQPGPGIKLCQIINGQQVWSPFGVLCEAGVRLGIGCSEHDGGPLIAYCWQNKASYSFPTSGVLAAAKLASSSGIFRFSLPGSDLPRELSIWRMGGRKFTFSEVAEVIESNPSGLFLPEISDLGTRLGSGGVWDLPESLLDKLRDATI